ncbi:hypothetical protein LKD70_11475 [Ruminococcus sp. CLA-AA-H200]|uniref:Uncharacterized protein n=1 Tax=Ruminococcus turbiniformis TaxID=2881258 RepID=A0ABS8FY94_9FIRM|nr:hypothetical protein [Ruminococcus turbiniformis]MCC2255033.1 hypothetical protein [Ruminococcus turbiniformis]
MEKKNMSWLHFFLLAGSLLAFLIGSGFASGQETIQYFSGYGYMGIAVGVINFCMMFFTYVAYAYAGRTRGLKNLNEVATFYAGKYVGKLFEIFAWVFVACCYIFMCSGGASTFNQQWGIPMPVGVGIMVGLSVITAVFGLQRIIDVIGWIGPVIVVFTLVVGFISAFTYFPRIPEGIALLESGAVTITRSTNHWLTAGLAFGGCSLLLVSNFVATLAYDNREYKFGRFKAVLFIGAFFISSVSVLMGMNHIGNIEEASTVSIPNLALASHIMGPVGALFAVIIIGAIYTTICPSLWNTVSFFFKDDKSPKYKTAVIAFGIVTYIICMFVPYEELLGVIMTYCGYTGAIVFAVIVIRYIMVKTQDKKEGIQV